MNTQDHRKILGILFFVQCGLQVFGGLIAVLIYGGMGAMMLANSNRAEDQTAGAVLLGVGIVAGVVVAVFALLAFLAGWKLVKGRSGARGWAIAASILSLLSFPLGTALGIYGLWFLFGDAGRNLDFENQAGGQHMPPPPPNYWQQ